MDNFPLHHILYDDALVAWTELVQDDAPRRRRGYVRTAFAAIEALTFVLKRSALESAERSPSAFSAAEVAMLRDESYAISSKGEAYSSPKFTPTAENFRFTVNMVMRATLPGFTLHVGVPGWEALKQATAIRNRLVHPKDASEMIVTDDELRCVQDAFFWVNDATVKALAQAVEVLHQETGAPVPENLQRIKERWQSITQQRDHRA